MEPMLTTSPRRRRRRSRAWLFLPLVFLLSAAAGGLWAWNRLPNPHHVQPDYMASPHPVMVEGQWTRTYALGDGDGLLIALPVAQKLLGDGIRYEPDTESIILTTDKRVMHFKTGQLDATINRKPFTLQFAAKKENGTLYVPIAPLQKLFGVQAETDAQSGIVSLFAPGQSVQRAEVPKKGKGVKLRSGPGRSYPIVEDLPPETPVRLWGEKEGWYEAQSKSGRIGYLAKGDAVLLNVETFGNGSGAADDFSFVAWKLTGQRINLTWEAVYSANPNPAKLGELTGVNVVSPTWFELQDGQGRILSKADAGYSAWARSKGMQVWALFSNGFEPDRTHQALASYATRFQMIQQLLAYAKAFHVQGINLDFENVKTEDKDNYVQFVRELTPLLHEQGLVVSVDVTPKSNSEFWSLFLDREKLGRTADFLIIMGYDEYWASSPVAGSVSSLPWAENTIVRIMQEDGVPGSKLILGSPFYTRLWTETPDGKNGVKVTSKSMSMDAVTQLIQAKKLKPVFSEETGQHYVEFKEGNATHKIWIEDADSVKARVALVKKYGLAGFASWNRSFASAEIWKVLDQSLQSHP